MAFDKIPGNTATNQQIAMMNKNFAQLANENVTKIYKDRNGIPSILIGLDSTGNSRIKVSKTGIDVTSANDADLYFNSAQNSFKVVTKSDTQIPAFLYGTGQVNYVKLVIPHGLSYTPIIQAYVAGKILDFSTSLLISSGRIPLPVVSSSSNNAYWFDTFSGSAVKLTILYGVDATNLTIQASSSVTSGAADTILSVPLTYYLLQETAN